jgi:uncharacterized protein (DUF1800 family)
MQPSQYGVLRCSRFLRQSAALLATSLALMLLAGPLAAQRSAVPSKPDTATIVHVLNRVGFGPRPGDVERVRSIGLAAYIEEQLHPERIANETLKTRLTEFETIGLSTGALVEKYFAPQQEAQRQRQQQQQQQQRAAAQAGDPAMMAPPPRPAANPALQQARQMQVNPQNELMQAKMLRAVVSEAQLEEVLTDFWFNHFNVFIGKGQVRQYLTEYERETIRPHVLGKFADMLNETAHSPAMLFYLDNFQSASPNPMMMDPDVERRLSDPRLPPAQRQQLLMRMRQQPPRQRQQGLNENYARELMELHTLGVDGGYTQQDVIDVARAFTGWTIDRPQQGGLFIFRPQMHDTSAKTILGVKFPAGGGKDEGDRVLDILARHPSTARHIAFKLAQRFVADEPPKALVDRTAKIFLDTKGDLRKVTESIITSPEFFAKESYRAKVKTPLEFVVSAVRATGATVTNAQPLVIALRNLGMPVYGCQPPTGYSMTADAWVNTGALLNRMNFAVSLVGDGGRAMMADGRGRGGPPRPEPPPQRAAQQQQQRAAQQPGRGRGAQNLARAPLLVDIASIAPDTSEGTLDKIVLAFLAGDASAATVQTIARSTSPQQMIALTLGSPEFQRR